MGFERFVHVGRSHKPKVTIRTGGHLGFNRGAIERYSLQAYEYAVLFYDRDDRRIGIRLTSTKEEGACKLRVRESGATISARAFLDFFEIDYSTSSRYFAEWDAEERMMIIELNKRLVKGMPPARPLTAL